MFIDKGFRGNKGVRQNHKFICVVQNDRNRGVCYPQASTHGFGETSSKTSEWLISNGYNIECTETNKYCIHESKSMHRMKYSCAGYIPVSRKQSTVFFLSGEE